MIKKPSSEQADRKPQGEKSVMLSELEYVEYLDAEIEACFAVQDAAHAHLSKGGDPAVTAIQMIRQGIRYLAYCEGVRTAAHTAEREIGEAVYAFRNGYDEGDDLAQPRPKNRAPT